MWPAAAPLIMCMHVCPGDEGIIYYYLHPAWGGLFEMENGLLFYELFFVTLHYSRTHCVRFYLTQDLNVVQNI